MTQLLEKAFAEAAKLSEKRQDTVALWIIAELDDEAKWDASFANSQDALAKLADKALAEYHAGKTQVCSCVF